jgi:hypothetical protein
MHQENDLDSSVFAGHHSLGTKAHQAAAGNHKHNDLQALIDALEVPKSFLYTQRAAAQNINNNVVVNIVWDTEIKDTDAMLDIASSNNILIKKEGYYLAIVKASYAANAVGARQFFLKKNGVAVSSWQLNANVTGTMLVYFPDNFVAAVNDIITVDTLQNSGGVLALNSASLSLLRVADL